MRSKVETTVLAGAVLTSVLVMYSVDAGCTDSIVVVPSGRVTTFVNVTAGATLVDTMRLVETSRVVSVIVLPGAVVVRSKVDTMVLSWVLVIYSVDASWIESTVVVPSGRLTRLVNVTAGATLVEMMRLVDTS